MNTAAISSQSVSGARGHEGHSSRGEGKPSVIAESANKRTVAGVMTRHPVTISPDQTIHEAAARLTKYRISGAPVVAKGELVGVISELDLMRAALAPAAIDRRRSTTATLLGLFLRGRLARVPEDATVASAMTRHVVTVEPTTTLSDAAATMQRSRLKRLPVVDDEGHLIGILSRADLVAAMARTDEELHADVLDAIALAGEEAIEDIEVEVHEGTATLRGTADRKTTKDVALRLASQVPGVIDVVDALGFRSDDSKDIPRQKDPWAVGPLVKGE